MWMCTCVHNKEICTVSESREHLLHSFLNAMQIMMKLVLMKISCIVATPYKTVCVLSDIYSRCTRAFCILMTPSSRILYKYCTVEIKGLGTRLIIRTVFEAL